jgi:hypothetical protein
MRNATRISCHRRDNGSILAEYEPQDRISLRDIELMVEDMLLTVNDDGEHSYEWSISPEIITIEKVGTIAVLEIKLTSSTICGRKDTDDYEFVRRAALSTVRGWRI